MIGVTTLHGLRQLPHYVLAKNTRSGSDIESSSSSSSGKVNHNDDLFDPLYESDEIDDEEYLAGTGGRGEAPYYREVPITRNKTNDRY